MATPLEHVAYLRIERARELPQYGMDNLEIVAARFGYRSTTVFSRAFVRCVGMPPSHYRPRR